MKAISIQQPWADLIMHGSELPTYRLWRGWVVHCPF